MNKTYRVTWETSVGGGADWYNGIETVKADDKNAAEQIAQFNVWRRGFQDFNRDHIVILRVNNE